VAAHRAGVFPASQDQARRHVRELQGRLFSHRTDISHCFAATGCKPVWRCRPRIPRRTVCAHTARLGMASTALSDRLSPRLATNRCEISGLEWGNLASSRVSRAADHHGVHARGAADWPERGGYGHGEREQPVRCPRYLSSSVPSNRSSCPTA
jgi:hypothetical protein